eukprot:2573332-Rhodomonas_salina.1
MADSGVQTRWALVSDSELSLGSLPRVVTVSPDCQCLFPGPDGLSALPSDSSDGSVSSVRGQAPPILHCPSDHSSTCVAL